jgi:hypothetical protein
MYENTGERKPKQVDPAILMKTRQLIHIKGKSMKTNLLDIDCGLAHPGNILHQDVAVAWERNEEFFQDFWLSKNAPGEMRFQFRKLAREAVVHGERYPVEERLRCVGKLRDATFRVRGK